MRSASTLVVLPNLIVPLVDLAVAQLGPLHPSRMWAAARTLSDNAMRRPPLQMTGSWTSHESPVAGGRRSACPFQGTNLSVGNKEGKGREAN